MFFFSIIIPIYNAELYLKKCLESILKQSYQNYEVLLIDDGSQDDSPNICKKICQYSNKFTYKRIVHSGASASRNYGIEKSRGKYLIFVDADDFIDENMLLELYNTISSGDEPDVCYMNSHYVIVDGKCTINTVFKWEEVFEEKNCLSVNKFLSITTKEGNYVPGSSCLMMCRREFIKEHKILFNRTVVWNEDGDFSYQILQVAEKVKCCGFCGYYYYMDNDVSVSKEVSADKTIGKMSVFYKWIVYFLNEKEAEDKFDVKVRERIVQQLLSEYCKVLNSYWQIQDRQERILVKRKLQKEREIWVQCTDKRFKDYVKYGVELGTLIQKLKRIIKGCLRLS